VRDTGIGMTAEQQGKLFQAFSQADTSTTRKYGGTGLGLTISKRLVNLMGGEIWTESEAGQGTTFHFTSDFGLGKETVKRHFEPSPDLRGLKVLVVDDNATSREILQDILESFTFEVYLSASGEEGLEEIEGADRDKPFELVIMDWKMPGMDGIEASRRIKSHQKLSKIPAIVLVTAYGREEVMRQADEIGLDGFLLKPVNSSVMFDAIMQALGREVQDVSRIDFKKEPDVEELNALSGARVLLVEDNEINQQVAREILQGAGLTVTVANNGQEGVDAATQNEYDVILMDIQMPVMDGYTATRKIREWQLKAQSSKLEAAKSSDISASNLQPSASNVPIIAMTAHAMAGDEQKSLDAGMNGHVTKPINPDQLFAALQKWIRPGVKQSQEKVPPISTQSPEATQTAPHEEALPESLPGFDLAAGLKDANDFEQAHSLVHNLKGLAGNLEAKDLQAATVEMEKVVKGQTQKTVSASELNRNFSNLDDALNRALEAVKILGLPVEKKASQGGGNEAASASPGLAEGVADRITAAAEMGDVAQIKSIAEELKSESDAFSPFCDKLVQLADDFDFDGIQKSVLGNDS
jgi:CheY-like chemotaxis protein/HPt (histidine-containing phosphotransfer) domain-containing protein